MSQYCDVMTTESLCTTSYTVVDPAYAVVHQAKNLYTLKPYGGVNHGVTILSPTNHTFYWT